MVSVHNQRKDTGPPSLIRHNPFSENVAD